MRDTEFSQKLLDWYDNNARVLPWRVSPADRAAGVMPDPYRVWLSEVMLQQTTVAAVAEYYRTFTRRWPTVSALAAARDQDVMGEWAGLGYYARARNLLKCARIIARNHGGIFPDRYDELLKLPGIGPYTAAAISAIVFERPETVLDGNIERVMSRVFLVKTPLPKSKPDLKLLAARLTPAKRCGDYVQAVMDLGATICTPKSPGCDTCPWSAPCRARCKNLQAGLPLKMTRKPIPTRLGIAYVGRRSDGAWLLEQRPQKGLLGGMLGWPGSEWGDAPAELPPVDADWYDPGTKVRHTFTHFHLILSLRTANLPMDAKTNAGIFMPQDDFRPSQLPTVMRKAFALATSVLPGN